MRKIVSAQQIQSLDRLAIEGFGIPSLVLMENAGKAIAQEARLMLKGKRNRRVAIICGAGNNGGDGFVAARHLADAGIACEVILIGAEQNLKPDPKVFYGILKKLKVSIRRLLRDDGSLLPSLRSCGLIVDALFGVGLNRPVAEPYFSVIAAINTAGCPVLAVDVPSGLDATTGRVHGISIRAARTITFSFAKRGLVKNDGPRCAGRVKVVAIGIPTRILKRI